MDKRAGAALRNNDDIFSEPHVERQSKAGALDSQRLCEFLICLTFQRTCFLSLCCQMNGRVAKPNDLTEEVLGVCLVQVKMN